MVYSKKAKKRKKHTKRKMYKGSGPKRTLSVSPSRSSKKTRSEKPPLSKSRTNIKMVEINISLMDNNNFKSLYDKRKDLSLKNIDLFIESNKEILKKIDEDYVRNILNDNIMFTNKEYYQKLDVLVHLHIIMDVVGDFDDIYNKIKELKKLKEEIQKSKPIGIADNTKQLEKEKEKYNIMINNIHEEYIELIIEELSNRGQ